MGKRENDWSALQLLIKYKVLKIHFCGNAILSLLILKKHSYQLVYNYAVFHG